MAVCQPDNITEQHNIKGGMTVTSYRQGAAIMMSKAAKNSRIEWTPISERPAEQGTQIF